MSDPLTFTALCGIEADASGLPVIAADRDDLLQSLRESAGISGLAAFNIGERLFDFLAESLRKPVAGIVGEVWSQRKELRKIAEKGKDKPNLEATVELFEHSIAYALHPSVEIQVSGAKVGAMTFDVTAKLKLEGLQVVIKNAWITQVKAGKLTSTLGIDYKGIPLMAPCKKTVDLKAQLFLPHGGIRLGGDVTPPPRPAKGA
jgi:hypothetical protein